MKAVVATSRMHEGSKRRTDSCEIPGSGTSRQSSIQQDPAPEAGGPAPSEKESTPEDDGSDSSDQFPSNLSSPRGPKPTGSKGPAPGPAPSRPPLRADGLPHASIVPKSAVQTQLPRRSFSVVDPSSKIETMSLLAGPPSPDALSNGLMGGAESASKTAPCQ